jgi:hypothetical protein
VPNERGVFDTCRDTLPEPSTGDLLEENGRGLGIINTLTAAWGSRPTRSRLAAWPIPGKLVWFTVPLPCTWPRTRPTIDPAHAAQRFHALLTARGIDGIIRNDQAGVSLLAIPGNLNLWVYPDRFTLDDPTGTSTTRPLQDLHDLTETVITHLEHLTTKTA